MLNSVGIFVADTTRENIRQIEQTDLLCGWGNDDYSD